MPLLTATKTKILELTIGGAIKTTVEKCDVEGLYERIKSAAASEPDYKKIVLDLSSLSYTNHNIIGLILQCRRDFESAGRLFEVRNAYSQPADILKLHGIKYHNSLPEDMLEMD